MDLTKTDRATKTLPFGSNRTIFLENKEKKSPTLPDLVSPGFLTFYPKQSLMCPSRNYLV